MEDFLYYFYNYQVQTSDVPIYAEGWQALTSEEIFMYKNDNFLPVTKKGSTYCFHNIEEDFDLEQYKKIKIEYLSGESFTRGEQIIPNYKYTNCIISKNLVERGEDPIYPDYLDIMIQYEHSRVSLRKEFYDCKKLVELATTKEEIDNINFEYEERT